MEQVETITFRERETNEECCVIVRKSSAEVALCLSRKSNGDVEVNLTYELAARLAGALHTATHE